MLAPAAVADSAPDTEGGAPQGELYTIGTDTTFAPFEFRDASSELVGIDIDLMKAIAEDQGFQVDGVIAGAGITEERQEVYDFSDSYFTGELTIAALEDSGIEGWEALEGEAGPPEQIFGNLREPRLQDFLSKVL